jgi:prophage regulatory protein
LIYSRRTNEAGAEGKVRSRGGQTSTARSSRAMNGRQFGKRGWLNHTARLFQGKTRQFPVVLLSSTTSTEMSIMSTLPKVLRMPSVQGITGMARSTLYKAMKDGQFPLPISLGARSVGWLESDVQAWFDARIQKSRATSAGGQNA